MNDYQYRGNGKFGRIWGGLFLLIVGGVLLLDQMGFPIPKWLFNWPVLLIGAGLFSGIRCGFRGGMWFLAVLVGGIFFYRDYFHVDIERYLWPGLIILAGIVMMVRPRNKRWDEFRRQRRMARHQWHQMAEDARDKWHQQGGFSNYSKTYSAPPNTDSTSTTEDFVDTTAIFSGIQRKIVSKNFKGGDITSVMGGTELDLSQADFVGMVRIDVTQFMGGTKLIVPPHWEVRSEITALFSGVEDKRQHPAVVNPERVLIISGTSVFGGIEMKNF